MDINVETTPPKRKGKKRSKKIESDGGFYVNGNGRVFSIDFVEISQPWKYQQFLDNNLIPKPRNYSSYQEYENALQSWESKICNKMSNLLLPNILGRFYSRPPITSDDTLFDTDDNSTNIPPHFDYFLSEELSSGKDLSNSERDTMSDSTTMETSGKKDSPSQGLIVPRPNRVQFPGIDGSPREIVVSGDDSSRSPGNSSRESRTIPSSSMEESNEVGPPNRSFIFESERWESVLITVEPDPLWYNNYEEYNQAMRGWVAVVNDGRNFLPPNCEQLGKMIPINIIPEFGYIDTSKWIPPIEVPLPSTHNWGLPNYVFFEKVVKKIPKENNKEIIGPFTKNIGLETNVINNVEKHLGVLLNHQNRSTIKQGNGKFVVYVHDAYGDTHCSIVPHPNCFLSTIEGEAKSGVSYLRRTALGVSSELEAKPKIGEKIRSVPVFDISVKEEKLLETEFENNAISEYKSLIFRYKNHHLYAWYNPDQVSPKTNENERRSIKKMMEKNLTHNEIIKILMFPSHVDNFLEAIEPSEGSETGFLSITRSDNSGGFYALTKKFDFGKIVEIFEKIRYDSQNLQFHARVALFILDALRSAGTAQTIINTWFKLDLYNISILPYLVHFFDPVYRDIFPYNKDDVLLMKQALLSPLQTNPLEKQTSQSEPQTPSTDLQKFKEKYWNKIVDLVKSQLDDNMANYTISVQRFPFKMGNFNYVTKCHLITGTSHEEITNETFQLFEKPAFRTELLEMWKQSGFKVKMNYSKISGARPSLITITYSFEFTLSNPLPTLSEKEMMEKKGEFDNLIEKFYRWYYMNETRNALKATKFVEASSLIIRESKIISKEIIGILKKDPQFLSLAIQQVGNRSSKVSSLFLFMLVQLIKSTETMGILLDPRSKLYIKLKFLSYSKFSHVKMAVRRLWDCIETYHLDDFKRFLKNNQFLTILSENTPILSEVVQKIVSQDLKKWNSGNTDVIEPPAKADLNYNREKMTYGWWIDDLAFTQLFNNLKNGETASVKMAYILSLMAKAFYIDKKESKKKTSSNISIKIEKDQINLLTSCIAAIVDSDEQISSSTIQLLAHLLVTLRQFVKLPDYFSMISHSAINSHISPFLDHQDIQLNREAWRTLYHMIKYNSNVLNSWIDDGKGLKNFLGPIKVGSHPITIENGLKYITKLFCMPPRISKKGKDKRSVENDIKLLINYFINQHVFTHIHMIYQNINKKSPGGVFHAACKFYYLLLTESGLNRLLKDCLKNLQWKGDIDEISSLFNLSDKNSKKFKDRILMNG